MEVFLCTKFCHILAFDNFFLNPRIDSSYWIYQFWQMLLNSKQMRIIYCILNNYRLQDYIPCVCSSPLLNFNQNIIRIFEVCTQSHNYSVRYLHFKKYLAVKIKKTLNCLVFVKIILKIVLSFKCSIVLNIYFSLSPQ